MSKGCPFSSTNAIVCTGMTSCLAVRLWVHPFDFLSFFPSSPKEASQQARASHKVHVWAKTSDTVHGVSLTQSVKDAREAGHLSGVLLGLLLQLLESLLQLPQLLLLLIHHRCKLTHMANLLYGSTLDR